MLNVVVDKPYEFIPPHRGRFWATLLNLYLPFHLNRQWGLTSVECRGVEQLRESLSAGHGILLTPNHCRPCDPMVMGMLVRQARTHAFIMASWHLFMEGRFQAWLIRRAGAFSVYREGMDRAAVNTAIDILASAERPLIVFPEGVISRSNDQLNTLMDGVALMARSAARKCAKSLNGKVVVHPVAIKYLFGGEIEAALTPVLDEIEARLSWQPQHGLSLTDRIYKVGHALLGLKEMEYIGSPRTGPIADRLQVLINHILTLIEDERVKGVCDGSVVARVKRLRTAILPDLLTGDLEPTDLEHRWRQLADLYIAQQLSHYPPDYIRSRPTPERLLETVERFQEDLTDGARIHRPLKAVIRVGTAIEVSADRKRRDGDDPLMNEIEQQLEAMLGELTDELTTVYDPA